MSPVNRQWAYVLSDIGRPEPPTVLGPDVSPADKAACEEYYARYTSWKGNTSLRSIGVTLYPIVLQKNSMFAFKVQGGHADDGFAQQFADAAFVTLTLIFGPTFDESPVALRIPASLLAHKRLSLKTLSAKQALTQPLDELTMLHKFGKCVYVSPDVLTSVWKLLPLVTKPPFFEAVHHYDVSVDEYCFLGDDIGEFSADVTSRPLPHRDAVRAQNAVENAFKAIEAVIGEPPKDDNKLRRKLKAIGLDPDRELVWWPGLAKECVLAKVRSLHSNRDKRAAHAKTGNRQPFTYYEIMDSQGLARVILLTALENEIKKEGEVPS